MLVTQQLLHEGGQSNIPRPTNPQTLLRNMEATMTTARENAILYLNRKNVELACSGIDVVAVIRDLFRLHASGQTILPDEAYMGWTNNQGEQIRSLNMPGYIGGPLNSAGTKIINANIANPSRGLPRASGLTMVYDSTSVRINSIMEGA